MTETRRRRRPGPLPVVLGALATFLIVLALLTVQLRAGNDPALGAGGQVVALARNGHHVVTRTSGAAGAPVNHKSSHPVTTRTSGGGESDDE